MRHTSFRVVLRVITPLLVAGVCQGQAPLSLQNALTQALANNPSLDVSRGRIHQAEAQRKQAGLSPNPRLYLHTEDIRAWDRPAFSYWHSTEDYAYLGQIFETGGKRARRIDVAATDVRDTQLRQELLERQIRAQVSTNYWAAAGAARIRDLYGQYLRTYDEDVEYIQNRVKEGVTAEVDLMRIRIERDRVRVQVMNSSRDYDRALVELYRAMGKSDFPPTTLTESLDRAPSGLLMPDMKEALSARPEGKISQEAVARAEANLKLQRANAKPDPEAFVGYKRNMIYDTLYASLQIDLPIRNRNQGNIGSAQAELQIARANVAVTEANIKADLTGAIRSYRDEKDLVDRLPATHSESLETVRLARAAYREGGIDLIRLLDAERTEIDFEMQYLQSLVQLRQSIVNLQIASGADLQP